MIILIEGGLMECHTHTHLFLCFFLGVKNKIRSDMHNVYKLCIAKLGKLMGLF